MPAKFISCISKLPSRRFMPSKQTYDAGCHS
jgi:hypothetical protein